MLSLFTDFLRKSFLCRCKQRTPSDAVILFKNDEHLGPVRRRPPLRGGIQKRRLRRNKTRDMRVGFVPPTQRPWGASFGY